MAGQEALMLLPTGRIGREAHEVMRRHWTSDLDRLGL